MFRMRTTVGAPKTTVGSSQYMPSRWTMLHDRESVFMVPDSPQSRIETAGGGGRGGAGAGRAGRGASSAGAGVAGKGRKA